MPPAALAIALLALVTLGYIGVCAASPFAACRRCGGFGYRTRTDRRRRAKRGRTCRHCRGTGRRIRTGRHLLNRFARIHHDGAR